MYISLQTVGSKKPYLRVAYLCNTTLVLTTHNGVVIDIEMIPALNDTHAVTHEFGFYASKL